MVGNGSKKQQNIVYCSTKIAPPHRSLLINGVPRPLQYSVVTKNDFDRIGGDRRADGQRTHFIDGPSRRRRNDGRALVNSRKHPATTIQEIIVQTNTFLSFPKRRFARFCANKIITTKGASNAPPDRISLISDGVSIIIIIILYRAIHQMCWPPFSSTTMNLFKIWKHLNMFKHFKDYKLSIYRDFSYYLRSIRWTADKLLFFLNENPWPYYLSILILDRILNLFMFLYAIFMNYYP